MHKNKLVKNTKKTFVQNVEAYLNERKLSIQTNCAKKFVMTSCSTKLKIFVICLNNYLSTLINKPLMM